MANLTEHKLNEVVTITCYRQKERMKRRDAMAFYLEGMQCSEGSEHERYETIFFQLLAGRTECSDEIPFYSL